VLVLRHPVVPHPAIGAGVSRPPMSQKNRFVPGGHRSRAANSPVAAGRAHAEMGFSLGLASFNNLEAILDGTR
jgi:hypothetical protein